MMRDPPHDAALSEPENGWNWLHVSAADRRIALHFDLVEEVVDPGPVVAVPGAAPWCRGLVSVGGQLLTLIDAGLLFADRPTEARCVVVLSGLPVRTALAVDGNLLTHADDEAADLRLDAAALSGHPAFQPGAALASGSGHGSSTGPTDDPSWTAPPSSKESAR